MNDGKNNIYIKQKSSHFSINSEDLDQDLDASIKIIHVTDPRNSQESITTVKNADLSSFSKSMMR